MAKFDPECIVLGETSYTDMEYYIHGNRKYHYPPLYESVTADQTMATRKMNEFFIHNLPFHLSVRF
jgi:hypothetical protein